MDMLDAAGSLLNDCLICYVRDTLGNALNYLPTLAVGGAAAAASAAGTVAGAATSAANTVADSFSAAYQHQQVHDPRNPYDPSSPAHADYDRKSQDWKDSGVHPSYWPDAPVKGDKGIDDHREWWAGPPDEPGTPKYFGGVRQD